MDDSILDTIKKLLGMDPEYDAFDPDVIVAINSSFSTLQQLGVGPVSGFMITDNSSKWNEFIGDETVIESVKSYIHLKARLLVDPPATSFAIDAMEKMTKEFEWRLNVAVERKGLYE